MYAGPYQSISVYQTNSSHQLTQFANVPATLQECARFQDEAFTPQSSSCQGLFCERQEFNGNGIHATYDRKQKNKTFIFTGVIGYAARNSKHITVLRMETIREYM